MTYFIIAKWNADKHPTHINHKETKAEAQAIVDKIGGFYVESEDYEVHPKYITVDPDKKTITVDIAQRDNDIVTDTNKTKIRKLESQETPRRLAESILSDDGKAWLTVNREKIAIERAKL